MSERVPVLRVLLAGHAACTLGEVAVSRWLDFPPALLPVVGQSLLGVGLAMAAWRRTRGALTAPFGPFVLWAGMWAGVLLGPSGVPGLLLGLIAAWALLEQLPRREPEHGVRIAVLLGFVPLTLPMFTSLSGHVPHLAFVRAWPTAAGLGACCVLPLLFVAWLAPGATHWAAWALAGVLALPLPSLPTSSTDRPPGILLLTVDTLRADDAASMEVVRRLSERGLRFEDAVSTSSWTVPSLASIHTGKWVANHGAGRNAVPWLQVDAISRSTPMLAERFRDAGWRTGAVVCNPFVHPSTGFERGFSHFDHPGLDLAGPLLVTTVLGRRADGTLPSSASDGRDRIDGAIAWLEQTDEPWFLWVHLLDPHLPYTHVVLPADDPLAASVGRRPDVDVTALRRGQVRTTPAVRDSLRRAYREEIAFADEQSNRLLDALNPADTVLFTSDHGEEFWDHGQFEHGHAIWPEIIDVPLVLANPDLTPAIRSEPVSLVDVAPTLLSIAGIESADDRDDVDGRDLTAPPDTDAASRNRFVEGTLYFEPRRAVLSGDWAWVDTEGSPGKLFDVTDDPAWTRDVAAENPDLVEGLSTTLREMTPTASDDAIELDVRALEELGYLSGE